MFANNHPFHENFFYHRPCPRGKLPSICTDINFSLLKYRKYQSFHALCFLCFWKASHSIRRQSSLYRRTESISRDYLVNRRRQSGYMKAVVRAGSCFPEFLSLRRRQKPFPRSNEFNDFVQSTRDLSRPKDGAILDFRFRIPRISTIFHGRVQRNRIFLLIVLCTYAGFVVL